MLEFPSEGLIKNNFVKLKTPDSILEVDHYFLSNNEANILFDVIDKKVIWEQQEILFYGKHHKIPRLTAWYGDEKAAYKYSGILNTPLTPFEELQKLLLRVEKACATKFNSVLLNKYRTGNDKVSWHSDNEKEFGVNPIIASLSLGQERRFDIREINYKDYHEDEKRIEHIPLNNGTLILMKGTFQHEWQHQIPIQKKINEPRINLTFRNVIYD
jgi:alkylated DNA repair dioxygenase AlkB